MSSPGPSPSQNSLSPDVYSALQHWTTFGNGGTASSTRVTAADFRKAISVIKRPFHASWKLIRPLDAPQLKMLLNGFRPMEQEDKWFVYSQGLDEKGKAQVSMVRSWTGYKIFELQVELREAITEGKDKELDADVEKEKEGMVEGWVVGLVYETESPNFEEKKAKTDARGVCQFILGVKLPDDLT